MKLFEDCRRLCHSVPSLGKGSRLLKHTRGEAWRKVFGSPNRYTTATDSQLHTVPTSPCTYPLRWSCGLGQPQGRNTRKGHPPQPGQVSLQMERDKRRQVSESLCGLRRHGRRQEGKKSASPGNLPALFRTRHNSPTRPSPPA